MGASKRTIKRWETSLTSWEDGVARMGKCVVNFQRIDQTLNMCIGDLIGCSRKVGEIVTSEMSFREKVVVYSALCHHALRPNKLPDDLHDLVKRLHWAEQERNKISHSLWDASEKFPETIGRKKTSASKGRLTTMEEQFTPDELEELGNLFEGVSTDLFCLTPLHIPKLSRKRGLLR